MSLPPKLDVLVIQQFEELLSEADRVLQSMEEENRHRRQIHQRSGEMVLYELHVSETAFYGLRTSFLSLIEFMSSVNHNLRRTADEIASLESRISDMKKLKGFIQSLKRSYEAGLLDNLSGMMEANIASDYMGQAEQLLGEGISGQFDHVPAAVLTGAVLEDALRRLCQRQNPPIDTLKPNGDKKTLDPLITDLQKANVFNKAKADRLKSWAKTRNYAAHGEFSEFSRSDVEAMILGVKTFIADYL